ncbi:hypothetical protein N7468_006644 [Penicillium chermesinum]|uniref:Uncharacterized protein n=1 Tax=Penicillium chermesinum TaxID=63820 RepID=A0A9W9NSS3_9EURO|nr:uncharacterized protein N7468_006644 [Penicillium chermesinum]KAJ5225419.1 hypothetical protein N7468_006644 [Penicillium chermesinum]
MPPRTRISCAGRECAETPTVDWESEVQLVSSLAKLQELERKIHELRQCIPAGILSPLAPISTSNNPSDQAASPSTLHHGLEIAAREGLANIEQFQSLWRSPELKPVWDHVQTRINESNGQLVQPTGMWEKDYASILAHLTTTKQSAEEDRLRQEEETERAKALSSEGGWRSVIERFSQRDLPGVHIIRSKNQDKPEFAVTLARAGMIFLLEGTREPDSPGVANWQVANKVASGRSPTKLELAILECLDSRPRKWDLAFLLDMISSYAEIKQTPCAKCTKLTNNAAQLPVIRRVQPAEQPTDSTQIFSFNAYHPDCL